MSRSKASMPRLHVSVASRGYQTARVFQSVLVLTFLGSMGYAGWCWLETERLSAETVRHQQSVLRAEAMNRAFSAAMVKEGLTWSKAEIERVHQRVAFANELAAKRAFSWTRLLDNLEVAIPARTSLQSVRLDFKENAINLKGRVLTLKDLDKLATRLERHEAFRGVRIAAHRFAEVEEERDGGASSRAVRAVSKRTKPKKHRVVEFELNVGYQMETAR